MDLYIYIYMRKFESRLQASLLKRKTDKTTHILAPNGFPRCSSYHKTSYELIEITNGALFCFEMLLKHIFH